MSAIRLARGFTGRSLVVKFAGCYHGHVDCAAGLAPARAWRRSPCPTRRACRKEMAAETIVLPYNDLAAVEAAFAERGDEIACRHHRGRRRATWASSRPRRASPRGCAGSPRAHGALLISDEVMTGFRCSAAGWFGLEGPYAAGAPDLFTFGKVMGGGLPRRGLRRPRRRHGAARAARARSTRRHALG